MFPPIKGYSAADDAAVSSRTRLSSPISKSDSANVTKQKKVVKSKAKRGKSSKEVSGPSKDAGNKKQKKKKLNLTEKLNKIYSYKTRQSAMKKKSKVAAAGKNISVAAGNSSTNSHLLHTSLENSYLENGIATAQNDLSTESSSNLQSNVETGTNSCIISQRYGNSEHRYSNEHISLESQHPADKHTSRTSIQAALQNLASQSTQMDTSYASQSPEDVEEIETESEVKRAQALWAVGNNSWIIAFSTRVEIRGFVTVTSLTSTG